MFDDVPPGVLQSWPPPSSNPQTKIPTVLAYEIVLAVLLNAVVALRFYSRLLCVTRKVHPDDWVVVPGYVGEHFLLRNSEVPH